MATRKDVADLAGVSVATVSYVLNHSKKVSQKVEEKVLDAAKRLDYHPNLVARSLVTKKSFHVAILVNDLQNPYYVTLLEGAKKGAAKAGYIVSRILVDASGRDQIMELVSRQLDGIIIAMQCENESIIRKLNIPYVGFAEKNIVNIDYSNALYEGIHVLKELGHQRIACICGLPSTTNDSRIRLVIKAMKHEGLMYDEDLFIWGNEKEDTKVKDGYAAMDQLLKKGKKFTAVYALNDLMAIGAIKRLKDQGLRVPDDVSVFGCDNIDIDENLSPTLSTIDVSARYFGAQLMESLLAEINHKQFNPVSIKTRFIQRDSIAKCMETNK